MFNESLQKQAQRDSRRIFREKRISLTSYLTKDELNKWLFCFDKKVQSKKKKAFIKALRVELDVNKTLASRINNQILKIEVTIL